MAYRGWPSAALLGPILLMAAAIGAHRLQFANRLMPLAGIAGVAVATVITAWSEYRRVAPYLGRAPLLNVLDALDPGILQAVAVGLCATVGGIGLTMRQSVGTRFGPRLVRGRSDNFGHAAWLSKRDASRLFPGPDETYGGIVVGEAYRVDQDRIARRAFEPDDRSSWGQGGNAPLLIDPCRTGSTDHAEKKSAHTSRQERADVVIGRELWRMYHLDPRRLICFDESGPKTDMARGVRAGVTG